MNAQTLAVLVPAVATVAVTVIGGVFTISSKRREKSVGEIYEAFDDRGKLLSAKNERITDLEQRLKEAEEERDECLRKSRKKPR